MIRVLSRSIREYKKASILTPLLVTVEVILECVIPFVIANLVNEIKAGCSMDVIIRYGLTLFVMSVLSLALGAGTATVFYLIQMLANMGGKLETLRYITLFTLFQPDKLLAGEAAGWVFAAVLGLLGTALYAAGILLFHRRDLPI